MQSRWDVVQQNNAGLRLKKWQLSQLIWMFRPPTQSAQESNDENLLYIYFSREFLSIKIKLIRSHVFSRGDALGDLLVWNCLMNDYKFAKTPANFTHRLSKHGVLSSKPNLRFPKVLYVHRELSCDYETAIAHIKCHWKFETLMQIWKKTHKIFIQWPRKWNRGPVVAQD